MTTDFHPATVSVEHDRVPAGTSLADLAQRIFDGDRIQYERLGLVDEFVIELGGVPGVYREQVRSSESADGRLARELIALALAPAADDELDVRFVRVSATDDAERPDTDVRAAFDAALGGLALDTTHQPDAEDDR